MGIPKFFLGAILFLGILGSPVYADRGPSVTWTDTAQGLVWTRVDLGLSYNDSYNGTPLQYCNDHFKGWAPSILQMQAAKKELDLLPNNPMTKALYGAGVVWSDEFVEEDVNPSNDPEDPFQVVTFYYRAFNFKTGVASVEVGTYNRAFVCITPQ